MRLTVNGESHEHTGDGTLNSLLEELGADADRVATVVDETVIPVKDRDNVDLKEGDRVEVLTFAAGG